MEITFYGSAEEVGRSCILISASNTKILLDAGIKLGGTTDLYPTLPDKRLGEIDAILVSHAHLDHIGYLPHIYSAGYRGSIYTLKPTIELMQVLISDYMKISNPQNVTKRGLEEMNKHKVIVEYKKEFKIKNLSITFIPSGHILGSAMIRVSDGSKSLLYTGDINLSKTRLLNGAEIKNLNATALIMESTYGGKADVFKDTREIVNRMVASIKETVLSGGKVIIPCFAVGRAEEMLLLLDDYMNSGAIPKTPIYVDGMINKAMRIHRHNVIYCRKELQSRILMSDYDPFKSDNFVPVEKKGMRNSIVNSHEGCIIVTTSGMITGGPIMFYLAKLAKNSSNKLILVGYQAEGTIGKQIQEGAKEVILNDRKVSLGLSIKTYHISAHADRRQLEALPDKITNLKDIFLVHGEHEKIHELKEKLSKKYNVIIPKDGENYKF